MDYIIGIITGGIVLYGIILLVMGIINAMLE